jgi:glycosidase
VVRSGRSIARFRFAAARRRRPDGVVEHLDHLELLGVNVLYLTPFFPSRSNHRYDASSFAQVDPVLGGDFALRRLVRAAHARGMKLLGDFTANHTGATHDWFQKAQADPDCDERGFYFWMDDGYVGWFGAKSLPKLNYESQVLRHGVFEDSDGVGRRWISGPDGLDGWRVDVANMTVATRLRTSIIRLRVRCARPCTTRVRTRCSLVSTATTAHRTFRQVAGTAS